MSGRVFRIIFLVFFSCNSLTADTYTFRACTQNLSNYGDNKIAYKRTKKTNQDLKNQKEKLTTRLLLAKCDIISVQEVLAKDLDGSMKVLETLADELYRKSKIKFEYVSGKANDPQAKLGFLYKSNLFEELLSKSYYNENLPRLSKYERNRHFSRGPLRLDLKIKKNNQNVSFFNFHFKSHSTYGGFDSSGYAFEQDRMQMAQALKDIVLETKRANPKNILILLGDRNGSANSASAKILSGELKLTFFNSNLCKLRENSQSSCPKHLNYTPSLVPLISNDPDIHSNSFVRNTSYKLIDEILIDRSSEKYVLEEKNRASDYEAGLLPPDLPVTDHPLLWIDVKL